MDASIVCAATTTATGGVGDDVDEEKRKKGRTNKTGKKISLL
jgi:hypothetical protein